LDEIVEQFSRSVTILPDDKCEEMKIEERKKKELAGWESRG
jgi:hypothetical protein